MRAQSLPISCSLDFLPFAYSLFLTSRICACADLLSARDAFGALHSDYLPAPVSSIAEIPVEEINYNDAGGWDAAAIEGVGNGNDCEFDSVNATEIDALQFAARYLLRGRPLLVKNSVIASWRQSLRRENLVNSSMAEAEVAAGDIPYASQFGRPSSSVSVGEYIARLDNSQSQLTPSGPPEVIFHAFPAKKLHEKKAGPPSLSAQGGTQPLAALRLLLMQENASLPQFLRADVLNEMVSQLIMPPCSSSPGDAPSAEFEIRPAVRQFFLGGRGGGAPAHPHSHAVNSLAWGRKRWRVCPPDYSRFSATSVWANFPDPATGWRNEPDAARCFECTQRGGDVVFVPANWGHTVVNVQESVGATTEFDVVYGDEEL
eukprot:SAG31_NODE_1123_length_9787_cov_5.258877_10_plen_374_part_00